MYPSYLRVRAGYTADSSPVRGRATYRDNQPFTFIPMVNS